MDASVSKKDLFEIYSLRWNIEVRFKAWKRAINMKQAFNTVKNYDHHQSLIYAALIFQLITLNVAANLKLGGRVLSLENFSKEIASRLLEVTDLAKEICFHLDPRQVIMEKRKCKSLMNQLLTT